MGQRQEGRPSCSQPLTALSESRGVEVGGEGRRWMGLLGRFNSTMVLPGHDGAATPKLGGFIYQLSW